jgi:hypothetical protein
MAGLKEIKGKLEWSLLDYEAMEEVIRVLEKGAVKYGADNYKKGLNRYQVLDAMQRHLVELMKGNEEDEETFYHHAAHIICNAMFYLHNHMHEKFTDEH